MVCLSLPNMLFLLNHETQQNQTLYKGVIGKVSVTIKKILEHDLQSNSKKFYNNLKVPPSECYCDRTATECKLLAALWCHSVSVW